MLRFTFVRRLRDLCFTLVRDKWDNSHS